MPTARHDARRCWPIGDGALGFWKALREVFPDTREQRCWFHKHANVLAALPKSAHPGAMAAMREIYNAEDIDKAQVAIKAFEVDYGAKYPKAVAKITDDVDVLLEFYNYPAEHWVHLRTTNPIESTFATVRLRTKSHQGPRIPCGGNRHGLQADRSRTGPLAQRERAAPGRARPRRRPVPQGQAARTPRRRNNHGGGRVKDLDPQELTIAPVIRRAGAVIDANRSWRRLMSLARWAFPDVWTAFCGSLPTATAVLQRWPDIRSLACARRATLTAVIAAHTRGVDDTPARAEAIRTAATGWAAFWDGHLDLDALTVDVTEHLTDLTDDQARVARFTAHSTRWWEHLYGDDELLLSVPGMGPVTAATVRAFLGAGSSFSSAKKAASYVGITPSTWSSGNTSQPAGRSPRKDPRRFAWRCSRPPAPPAAPTRNWRRSTTG